MKKMTCRQLGGACDKEFQADTFEEMANLSKAHGMEMFQASDKAHLEAMDEMKKLMQSPQDMQKWFAGKKQEFENLSDIQ